MRTFFSMLASGLFLLACFLFGSAKYEAAFFALFMAIYAEIKSQGIK